MAATVTRIAKNRKRASALLPMETLALGSIK